MHWPRRLAIFVLVLAVLAPPASASAAARLPLALGMNLADAPGSLPTMQSFAQMSGSNPSLVMWYQQWSEPLFYSTQLPHTQALGAIPLITWDPMIDGVGIPLAQIAAGDDDSYITQSADAARTWAGPIFIRLAHEMNIRAGGYGPGQNGNTAAGFLAAWRHVVTIFRQQGATNVEWVWSPNADCGGKCPFASLYPGDAWVDWVALDGYNYSSVDGVPWETFDQIFRSSYNEMTALTDKPMMIAETASAEAGGNKAQWITQTFSDINQNYPQIDAVVWFDRVKETDWTVNSSASSLAAWQSVVASPANQGTASTLLQESPLASDVDSQTTGGSAAAGPPRAPSATTTTTTTQAGTPSSSACGTTTPTTTNRGGSTPLTAPATNAGGADGAPATTAVSTPATPPTISPASDAGGHASAGSTTITKRDVRTAVTATLRRILRRRGGLRQFARSLRTHAETISFTAPATGTIAVKVYLGERRAHRRRPRHALVAAAQRTLHGTGRTRVPVRPTERGRHELRRDFGRRITVRLCFTPRGNRRLAASARVRSG